MGYYEVPCQLCGVSFNIGRIRTAKEPRDAAWSGNSHTGSLSATSSYVRAHFASQECRDAGCTLVYRGSKADSSTRQRQSSSWLDKDYPEEESPLEDPSYETQSDDTDGSVDDTPDDKSEGASMDLDATEEDGTELSSSSENGTSTRMEAVDVNGILPQIIDTEFHPLFPPDDESEVEENENETDMNGIEEEENDSYTRKNAREHYEMVAKYEHIAAPDCEHTEGYHGDQISVVEMRGCQTVQCLVLKGENWKPQDDDMEFEKTSSYQLTGLADHMPSGGHDLKFSPVRNGVESADADHDDFCWHEGDEDIAKSALAFHPTCFELFMLASKVVLGKVDADGLVKLRNSCFKQEESWSSFCTRSSDVQEATEQVWQHYVGDEYLAANPIFIPKFRTICEAAVSNPDDFSIQQSAFPARGRDSEVMADGSDPFLKLPAELIQDLVSYLSNTDLANIRLSSFAFKHLPISIWYDRFLKDFPSVFEAWCDQPHPYIWARPIASEMLNIDEELSKYFDMMLEKSRALQDNDDELYEVWRQNQPQFPPWFEEFGYNAMWKKAEAETLRLGPILLPREKTNWYRLYTDIVVNWRDLRGLWNRKRIWADVCDIVHKIKSERDIETENQGKDLKSFKPRNLFT